MAVSTQKSAPYYISRKQHAQKNGDKQIRRSFIYRLKEFTMGVFYYPPHWRIFPGKRFYYRRVSYRINTAYIHKIPSPSRLPSYYHLIT
jgi:hypothetical protein